jgi:hypothetical protein
MDHTMDNVRCMRTVLNELTELVCPNEALDLITETSLFLEKHKTAAHEFKLLMARSESMERDESLLEMSRLFAVSFNSLYRKAQSLQKLSQYSEAWWKAWLKLIVAASKDLSWHVPLRRALVEKIDAAQLRAARIAEMEAKKGIGASSVAVSSSSSLVAAQPVAAVALTPTSSPPVKKMSVPPSRPRVVPSQASAVAADKKRKAPPVSAVAPPSGKRAKKAREEHVCRFQCGFRTTNKVTFLAHERGQCARVDYTPRACPAPYSTNCWRERQYSMRGLKAHYTQAHARPRIGPADPHCRVNFNEWFLANTKVRGSTATNASATTTPAGPANEATTSPANDVNQLPKTPAVAGTNGNQSAVVVNQTNDNSSNSNSSSTASTSAKNSASEATTSVASAQSTSSTASTR